MSIRWIVAGRVIGASASNPLGGVEVRMFVGGSARARVRAVTGALGDFTLALTLGRADAALLARATLRFALHRTSTEPAFHRESVRAESLLRRPLVLAVPDSALAVAFREPRLRLFADELPARRVEVGQTLSVAGSGLVPSAMHDVRVHVDRKLVATVSLAADAFGSLATTVVVPQLGLSAFDTGEALTLAEGLAALGGRTLAVEVARGPAPLARARVPIERDRTLPIGFVSDARGRLANALQHDRDALHLTLANIPAAGSLRVLVVPRQGDWNPGDAIAPALDRHGRPLVFDLRPAERLQTVTLAEPGTLLPGAYDLIVRPVRYGFEADDALALQPRDVVIGRAITGLVVREDFWRAKPVLGGCVNALPISGSPVPQRPYFRYRDTFVVGENVWAALDPGIVVPGQVGKKVAFYVVQSKTPAQWGASTSLAHVPPGQPVEIVVQSGCINANKALVWPAAATKGSYDIVADFGNNDPNPANFVKDGSYDTPQDMIDGYFVPGFRIVDDPGTMSEFANVGAFEVDATLLSTLGLSANLTVQDENTSYFTPGGFTPINVTFQRLATVRFPADAPGATSAAQLSVAKPDYPLAVVVHGNGHNYQNYGFLLEHLARNGFVAMSINLQGGMNGLGRANAFFDHLATIKQIFGSKLQNNVGVLGHSRGGEAVFKIARLNDSLALGIGLNALIALGPTDQYGRETITGTASVPLFVLYGAKDNDVSGWPPYAGYNVRQSGFTLYDRFDGKAKSMAFVYEATHNGFVNYNEIPVALTVAHQQSVLLAYTNAFFRMRQRGEAEWLGMFTGEWKPPSVGTTPAEIHFQYRDTQRRAVDDAEGAHSATSWQTSTIGDAVTQTGLPADPVETQLYPQDNQSPHDTGGLRMTWDSSGDAVDFALPAGQRNVSGFAALSVRAAQIVGSASNPPAAQNFRVALRDGAGNERWIRVAAFGAVPLPAEANVAGNKKSALATVRIPLSAYTIVCAGAVKVDLTNVTNVKLQFTENASGEIAVDELEFAN